MIPLPGGRGKGAAIAALPMKSFPAPLPPEPRLRLLLVGRLLLVDGLLVGRLRRLLWKELGGRGRGLLRLHQPLGKKRGLRQLLELLNGHFLDAIASGSPLF